MSAIPTYYMVRTIDRALLFAENSGYKHTLLTSWDMLLTSIFLYLYGEKIDM